MKRLIIFIFALFMSVGSAFAMYCHQCQAYNDDRAHFCSGCGAPLAPPQEAFYCPKCGYQNPYGSSYCGGCRYDFHGEAPYAQPAYGGPGYYGPPQHKEHPHGGWRTVGTVTVRGKGGADELPGAGPIRRIRIRGIDGTIVINTVQVREGGNHTPVPITTRFSPGQEVVRDLPREMNTTGFRISKEGNGSVEVSVQ